MTGHVEPPIEFESLTQQAIAFRDMCYGSNRRLDEHERQIQELWRRIHSISEMIEDRQQH